MPFALRWGLREGRSVNPKSTKASRIAENIDVFDSKLSTAELREIDGLDTGHCGGPEPLVVALEAFGGDTPESRSWSPVLRMTIKKASKPISPNGYETRSSASTSRRCRLSDPRTVDVPFSASTTTSSNCSSCRSRIRGTDRAGVDVTNPRELPRHRYCTGVYGTRGHCTGPAHNPKVAGSSSA